MIKRTITLCFIALTSIVANAQNEGVMSYTVKVDLHAGLGDDANSQMAREMLPHYQTIEKELLYSKKASMYQSIEEDEISEEAMLDEGNEGGIKIKFDMEGADEKTHTNFSDSSVTQTRDLMGKTFLIKGTIKSKDWKILEETKVILGMNCLKATLADSTDTIEVWFTTEIPISSGPEGLGGLPGLILEVSMDGGNYTVIATKNELRELKKSEMKPPAKGKEVTEEEFQAISEEKMKQMREMHDIEEGDGMRVIIMEEN